MSENIANIDGRRFKLTEIPSQLVFRFQDEDDYDWSWIEEHESFAGEWGMFGPIDVDGNEYAALLVLAERMWEDGHRETVDALGNVTVNADDPTIAASGIAEESPWTLAEIIDWLQDYPETTDRHYLATVALGMAAEAGVKYHDCPHGCPTVPLDPADLEHHMGWHRAEKLREIQHGRL